MKQFESEHLRNSAAPKPGLTWESAPDILTVREAASLVRISTAAAYGAIDAGLLPAYRFGPRRTRIAKSALREVFGLEKRDKPAPPPFSQKGNVEN